MTKKNKKHEASEVPEDQLDSDMVEQEQTTESPEETEAQKITELEDKILRVQAEFQNFRKRSFREISNARKLGVESTVSPFLQVFDHFSMAVKAANESNNMDAIRQGLNMILDEYRKALDELGIVSFDAVGAQFDPNEHEAMAKEPSDEVPEGVVIKQWNCGYKMGDKLLRPANVVVSSGPAEIQSEQQKEEQ